VTGLRLQIDTEPERLATARSAVRALLESEGVSDDVRDLATLLVSELATNAIVHGDPPRELRCALDGGVLRVEVEDCSPVAPTALDGLRSGGHGLRLVDRLASIWGVQRLGSRKAVWFELAVDESTGWVPEAEQR
jgi:anti-sigma regulatory factor (Ser/Thr protein kinase)